MMTTHKPHGNFALVPRHGPCAPVVCLRKSVNHCQGLKSRFS
jgi:hypothetical protein